MSLRRLFTPLLLALTSLLLWCYVTDRWNCLNWQTPLQLHGDPLDIHTHVQAAAEDFVQPLLGYPDVSRLAAPFGADWRRYPVADRLVFSLLGLLASIVGSFTAVNLAVAAVHSFNALAFYLCARFLRWRREWAFALALLFSFSSYNFRWGVSLSFSLTFFVPPLLLLCGWIARPAPVVRPRSWTWAAFALGAWLGGANPYLGFFSAQLVALAVVLQLVRRRVFARCRAGAVFLVTLGGAFLLNNASYFLAPFDGGARLTLARNYAGSEIYALKLSDLAIPPAEHVIAAIGKIGRAYQAQTALRGEFFVNYLGCFGLIGLGLIVWVALRSVVTHRPTRMPDAALGVAWTLIFSAVGGLNSLLALGGLDIFRASNRNSIFILVWALWFFGRWCQRHWHAVAFPVRYALPLAIALVGVADSVPHLHAGSILRRHAAELRANRELMRSLEQTLGAGARIFQVPAPPFPEAGSVGSMSDYEHFLPYLTSHTLRFSYGALRGTPLARGLQALARVPAKLLRDELEATGFHALWIDRRGLADPEKLISGLHALGLQEIPQTLRPEIAIFGLNPADHPRALDLTDPSLFEPWDMDLALPHPRVTAFDGWFELERDGPRFWRWAQTQATAELVMPESDEVQLTFRARSLAAGYLALRVDGREVWRADLTSGPDEYCVLPLRLAAGRHRLSWDFSGELVRPVSGDARLLGFAVENLHVRLMRDPRQSTVEAHPPDGHSLLRRAAPIPSAPSQESNSPAADVAHAATTNVPTPSSP